MLSAMVIGNYAFGVQYPFWATLNLMAQALYVSLYGVIFPLADSERFELRTSGSLFSPP